MTKNAFTPSQGVPTRLVAGDFWAWRIDGFANIYPSSDYSLSYSFTPRNGGAAIAAAAVADADGWSVSVLSGVTSNLESGLWIWVLSATRNSDGARVSILTDTLNVDPNPTAASVATPARKQLNAINAVLEGRITKDVETYSIEGRALTRIPFVELRIARARLVAEVAAEDRAAAGYGSGPRYKKMRF